MKKLKSDKRVGHRTGDFLIGFVGQGFVGKNYADNFESRGFSVVRYSLEAPYIANREAIASCDIVFIAVPTPTTPDGADTSIVAKALKLIGHGKIAVIKSTVVPGTTKKFARLNPNIYVVHAPEFLTESNAVYDTAHPSRNIVGIPKNTVQYKEVAKKILSIVPKSSNEMVMSAEEAELVKYGSNCWLYFKVVYANLLYDLSKGLGADWENVRNGMSFDPRIGSSHLNPVHQSGRGAGGHCFIKDFSAMSRVYKKMIGDIEGVKVFQAMEGKNTKLLLDSGKDFDLLSAVYGDSVVRGRRIKRRAKKI